MPAEMLKTLPGYDPDVVANRRQGSRDRAKSTATGRTSGSRSQCRTRNVSGYRDAAVIMIYQLREIYIDAVLDTGRHRAWYPRLMRKDFTVGLNLSAKAGWMTPTSKFYENYACSADRNYTGYCSPEVDKLVDQQSIGARRRKAQTAGLGNREASGPRMARPVIFYPASATCQKPEVKGHDDDGQQHLQRLRVWKMSGSTTDPKWPDPPRDALRGRRLIPDAHHTFRILGGIVRGLGGSYQRLMEAHDAKVRWHFAACTLLRTRPPSLSMHEEVDANPARADNGHIQ